MLYCSFFSDARLHDYEQVEGMERRVMEIHQEEFGLTPKYWHRVTDGCQAEFKSLKTTLRLAASPQTVLNLAKSETDYFISWNYFESHEGKSRSDGIGAVVKTTLEKAIRKKASTIVTRASEAISVLRYFCYNHPLTLVFL